MNNANNRELDLVELFNRPEFQLPSGLLHPEAERLARQLLFRPAAEIRSEMEKLADRLKG